MTSRDFDRWLAAYFRAWQSNSPEEVAALFAPGAVYHYGPFAEPTVGRDRIVARWVGEAPPAGGITFRYEPLCVHGGRGMAHWNVSFATDDDSGGRLELDGILLLDFDEDARCVRHQEWYVSRRLDG